MLKERSATKLQSYRLSESQREAARKAIFRRRSLPSEELAQVLGKIFSPACLRVRNHAILPADAPKNCFPRLNK